MTFRMRDSIYPDDRMVFTGTVTGTCRPTTTGCAWVDLDIAVSVTDDAGNDRVCTTCTARVADPDL